MRVLTKIILLLFATAAIQELFATAQYGDILIINNDSVWIDSNPLEEYFEKKGVRKIGETEMQGSCTALWRGYVATWKLENDSLFLIRIQTDYCGDNKIEVEISKEFGTKMVFANWVSHTIIRPKGELLHYVHMGYMSIYEGNIYYTFERGKLMDTKIVDYLERDKNLIFPGETFLRDTITRIILNSIDWTERLGFDENSSCFIQISFNKNRQLSKINLGYGKEPITSIEKTILQNAIEALVDFPKLMKVNHERYYPPNFQLWFSGHCLRFPFDRAYGCNYE